MNELERFHRKVDRTGACWLWTGALNSAGYGNFWAYRRNVLAHRFSYETFIAPIPKGYQIDHLCRVTQCVNPEHLEPVTHLENILRGALGYGARRVCKSGKHDITNPMNIKVRKDGHRECLSCLLERRRK